IEHAAGEFVACFDSDDIWLPHHLHDCITALRTNPDVGWVYGACKAVDQATGQILNPNTFYEDGKPRAFLQFPARTVGLLRVLGERGLLERFLRHGLYCGLQASVMRRSVLNDPLFRKRYTVRIGEDLIIVLLALLHGCQFGYLDRVHT